ncbi:MAG TPA: DUF1707 domain-containing protein [Micromonosporaceae bacterium]|nr:DUF1707 domain-containing protein [Micromonosporaceae bacterium]
MATEGEDTSRDLVRASDLEREQVLSILQEAMAQGRITADEYSERAGQALAARNLGELRPLLADLPVHFPATGPGTAVSGEAVEWRGTFGSLSRRGGWTVPARIRLHRRMGSIDLDFTDAHFTSAVVDIELDVAWGSVELRLPDGAGLVTDAVVVTGGSVEDKRRNAVAGGHPQVRLSGTLRWGSLEIRGPRRLRRR